MNDNVQKTSIVDIETQEERNDTKFNQQHNIYYKERTSTLETTANSTLTLWNSNNNNESIEEDNSKKKLKSVLCRVAIVSVVLSIVSFIVLVWYFMGWMYGLQAFAIAIIAVIIASGKWRWFYIAGRTAKRDLLALFGYIKVVIYTRKLNRQDAPLGEIFLENVKRNPHKPCIIYEDQTWSFDEINKFSNKIANSMQKDNLKKGSVVALLMDNRPEFVATWIGLLKMGAVVPLINTNQRNKSLLHSINIVECDAVIFAESFKDAMDEIIPEISKSIKLYQYKDKSGDECKLPYINLQYKLLEASEEEPIVTEKIGHHDKALFIYTSGTTGLPKAAVLNHARFVFIVAGIHFMGKFDPNDIYYTPLPLYHTAGGVMSIGQAILFGSTVVIRKKFSASNFFQDCQKYNCTVAQYIGEMCRYMLATTPSSSDRNHKLRLIFGNGLRPQIWTQFCERFSIERVVEFYGATEGNANISNVDNTIGSIGFVSRILPQVYPISIIRADPLTGDPIRGPDGLCQVCKANEPGVFIGKILPGNASRQFLGYADKKASEKKIVKDVFKKGDSAFISGDILVSDDFGYLYFKDRTGDTFRWKGENVSTSEVEAYVSNEAGFRDTVVYGVEIPNTDGRAGMAAILDPENEVDFEKFSAGIKKTLPSYARPIFIRLLTKVDLTGTFKLKKLDLQKEGFDLSVVEDKIYYLTLKSNYELLTKEIYNQICDGKLRF